VTVAVHPAAVELVGVPWRLAGRDPSRGGGCDCVGIVLAFLHRIGIEAVDPTDRTLVASWSRGEDRIGEHLRGRWMEVTGSLQVGDVFWTREPSGRDHCGVYVGGERVLESSRNVGAVLSDRRRLSPRGWFRWIV
jgi:cell wall-associated NlpC family hydrolase